MEAWREELYSDELYHFGIPGMKWGVRRFQNEDGSLTEAGRRRYGVGKDGRFTTKAGYLKYKKENAKLQKIQSKEKAKADAEKKKTREAALKKARETRAKNLAAKKEAEEAAKKDAEEKDRIIKSGSYEEVLNRKDLTPQELQYARMRLNERQQIINNMPKQTIEKGKTKAQVAVDKFTTTMDTIKKVSDGISTASDAVKNTVKGINTGIAIYNAVTNSNVKKIDLEKKKPTWDDLKKEQEYLLTRNKYIRDEMKLEKDKYNHDRWRTDKDDWYESAKEEYSRQYSKEQSSDGDNQGGGKKKKKKG